MKNNFLATLAEDAFELLKPDLRDVDLEQGQVLYRADEPVTDVYFPHGGLISLVVTMRSGKMAETSLVGRDGFVCSAIVLDVQDALDQATVEIPAPASRMSAKSFINAYRKHEELRTRVNRHHAMIIAEGRQSTACNAIHDVDKRFCRWLANAFDQSGAVELALKQDLLARMLGVQRSTLTTIYNVLQEEKIISVSRGHIRVLDREALQARACECYGILRDRFLRVFPDWPQPTAAP